MDVISKLHSLFDEALQGAVPADLREQGWVYRDLPGRCTPEAWDQLLSVMGHDNYKIIAGSAGPGWVRGQFFLSPKAIENMRHYASGEAAGLSNR